MKPILKRMLSGVLSVVTTISVIPIIPVHANESTEPYPYTMFAASGDEGAITVNAGNFCVNGNIATNGTIVSSGNMNVNGTRAENADGSMIFIFDKIDNRYFSASNVEEHDEDYTLDELNININVPTEVQGEATFTGNININSALKALEDVNLYGEVKNTNDSVIFSKYGDIVIDSQNVNLNGLVYAPFGKVDIKAQNLNLNNVVIIAESIELTCPNVNANNSGNMSSFIGNTSEGLDIPVEEWEYLKDENENGLPDFFEDFANWELLKDTDGDQLPDPIEHYLGTDATLVDSDGDLIDDYYEFFVLCTDPTLADSDENGVADGNEDFDDDWLSNYEEYILSTLPWDKDSDKDSLSDGDEVHIYGTNPLIPDSDSDGLNDADEIAIGTELTNPTIPDTDGNGTLDGKERFSQTYVFSVDNDDCAVEEVIVSMNGTGYLQNTTSIESIMETDSLCSEVVGLVGEPFSIETSSEYDTATLSFKINRSKLGDSNFNDLIFLWYDEDNYKFVELDTEYDELNDLVSVQTNHFSRYMVVDKYIWYAAWAREFDYNPGKEGTHGEPNVYFNTVLAVDCSGSMDWNDQISYKSDIASAYDGQFAKTCQRIEAATHFVANMNSTDNAAVVLFTGDAEIKQSMTNNVESLRLALQNVTSDGGTSFYQALLKSYTAFNDNMIGAQYTNNRIILLSDGEDGDYGSTMNLVDTIYATGSTDRRKSIRIYTIGLGESSDSRLEQIATKSGGQYFSATTASELVNIYAQLGFGDDFDITDNDYDGLYDVVEAAGIRLQNGTVLIGCNPTKYDTDGDTVKDGAEIYPIPQKSNKTVYNKDGSITTVKGYYFIMKSNPTKKDSDGDLDNDNIDPHPLQYQLNDCFVDKVQELEKYAQLYNDNAIDWLLKYSISKEYWLSLMFIRSFADGNNGRSNYINGNWPVVGGEIDWRFVNYVYSSNPELYLYFQNTSVINANPNGEYVDLRHFAATATVYIYKTDLLDSKYFEYKDYQEWYHIWSNLKTLGKNAVTVAKTEMFEYNFDNLGGWAGDLQTLMNDTYNEVMGIDDYDTFYTALYNSIGTNSFSMDDMYADTDAYNIYIQLRDGSNSSLSEAFADYYTDGYLKRYSSFTNNWDEDTISDLTYTYTKNEFAHLIQWPLFDFTFSTNQSKAARDAFVRFLMEEISYE